MNEVDGAQPSPCLQELSLSMAMKQARPNAAHTFHMPVKFSRVGAAHTVEDAAMQQKERSVRLKVLFM